MKEDRRKRERIVEVGVFREAEEEKKKKFTFLVDSYRFYIYYRVRKFVYQEVKNNVNFKVSLVLTYFIRRLCSLIFWTNDTRLVFTNKLLRIGCR